MNCNLQKTPEEDSLDMESNSVRVSMSDVMFLILFFFFQFVSCCWCSQLLEVDHSKMPPGRMAFVFVESVLCFS